MTIGGLTALLTFSTIRDRMLISDLSSDDATTRQEAAGYLFNFAREYPDTVARLNDALDTDSDLQFRMVAAILRRLSKWQSDDRDVLDVDRLNTLDLLAGQGKGKDPGGVHAFMRQSVVTGVLTRQRDNVHVRKTMSLACTDADVEVRQLGTMLAGRFGEDEILRKMLGDADPSVAAAAALSAAAGGRKGLIKSLRPLLKSGGDAEVVSAAAYALATMDAENSGQAICALLQAETPTPLRDRLLHVMTVLNTDAANKTVSDILAAARTAGRYPSAMAIVAAGKLKLTHAEQDVRDVLAGKRTQADRNAAQAQAAIETAGLLALNVRDEVYLLLRNQWGAKHPDMLQAAMHLLGRLVARDAPHTNVSDRLHCLSLFSLAADSAVDPRAWPGRSAAHLPAAAAAIELWRVDRTKRPDSINKAVRFEKDALPGDYVAWHVAGAGEPAEAMKLGLTMLPLTRTLLTRKFRETLSKMDTIRAVDAILGRCTKAEKAAGAMLLALTARTDKQRTAAIERIELRLKYETELMTAGAYKCALLILGQKEQFETVRLLRGIHDFPRRRVITALLAAGDRETMDWFVLNPRRPLEDVAGMLTMLHLDEVVARILPTLPTIDRAGTRPLQQWQARIVRHYWAVRRGELVVELR